MTETNTSWVQLGESTEMSFLLWDRLSEVIVLFESIMRCYSKIAACCSRSVPPQSSAILNLFYYHIWLKKELWNRRIETFRVEIGLAAAWVVGRIVAPLSSPQRIHNSDQRLPVSFKQPTWCNLVSCFTVLKIIKFTMSCRVLSNFNPS